MTLEQKCDGLRTLHVPGRPLVLPNAWDVWSARAVVAAGFPVVATTSGGVAEALGYEDGEAAPPDQMLAAAARIARSVDAPVTVDAEAGYGMQPEAFVEALLVAGAAGCNFEDTDHRSARLEDPRRQAARIAAIRRAAKSHGYGLVINARVDVFLSDHGQRPEEHLPESVERARAYMAAGADCVYPIFLSDEGVIARFVEAVAAPANILAIPRAPSLARLAELGVARISYGSSIQRRLLHQLSELLAEIRG